MEEAEAAEEAEAEAEAAAAEKEAGEEAAEVGETEAGGVEEDAAAPVLPPHPPIARGPVAPAPSSGDAFLRLMSAGAHSGGAKGARGAKRPATAAGRNVRPNPQPHPNPSPDPDPDPNPNPSP